MTTYRVKVEVDTDTDRFAVWKDGIGWVEFDVMEAARQIIYGPIPHEVVLCGPTDHPHECDCWCQACEMHNARAVAPVEVTA